MAVLMAPGSLVLPQTHLIHAEIVSVTSAMRKNARWSGTSAWAYARNTAKLDEGSIALRRSAPASLNAASKSSTREPPREADLMAGFEGLKRELAHAQDIHELPTKTLLAPFLALIKSPFSTGPIAYTILSSLHTFFIYGLIKPESPEFRSTLVELCDALSHLRFEGSDPTADEAVSLRLLSVIEVVMSSPTGDYLGDVEVCEMLEAVLTICCQMRRGEVLRRSAEATMHSLVRTVFSRLKDLKPEEAEDQLSRDEEAERARSETVTTSQATGDSVGATAIEGTAAPPDITVPNLEKILVTRPYGLLSIRELLRVVVNLLDPTDPAHTDSIRLTALGIITVALSVSVDSIPNFRRSLMPIITDKTCKYLFQLVASSDEGVGNSQHGTLILERSLRIAGMLFSEERMRRYLKLQLELFLSFALDRLSPPSLPVPNGAPKLQLNVSGRSIPSIPGPSHSTNLSVSSSVGVRAKSPDPSAPSRASTSTAGESRLVELDDDARSESVPHLPPRLGVLPARGETRELLMETLLHLATTQPSLITDLWVNYDCDLTCEDIFDKLIAFLTLDPTGTQYTSQLLCLDLLLAFVNHMAHRADNPPPTWDSEKPTAENMLALKQQKKLLLAGTARFNIKPKTGLAFLEEKGLISAAKDSIGMLPSRSRSLARFLKKSPRLDKKLLGEYISRPENAEVLKEFINLYDFHGKSVAEALRELLESFRLPGEAQQIERITSTFAECFFAAKPSEIQTQDAVFILAYAVIMLNTDQHSPNIRKRMALEDFQRNLRGVNGNSDFSPQYLRGIFDSIRKREIIVPQEHTGQAGFDYAWKELVGRSESTDSFVECRTDVFDEAVFKLMWRPVVNAIANAFITFDDELVVQDVIAGFRQCATLAAQFKLPEVFDFLVMSLSRATGLLAYTATPASANFPIVEVDGQNVTVSPLSIRLGTSFRGQMAAVVLFTIANGNGDAIRDGWAQIFEMFQALFLHSLLPARMIQSEDFLGGVTMIPMQGNATTPLQARSDGGLLSTLSSYLMTPYGSESVVPEVTDRDIESTLSAIDCIAACRLDELYMQIARLDVDALVTAQRALVDLARRRTLRPLQVVYDDDDMRMQHDALPQIPYDPASVFLLETMISITVQTPDKIEDVWPIVFPHISAILSSASRFSVLLIERAVVGLLRIALIVASNPTLRDQLYIALDLLNGLSSQVLNGVAEQLVAGLSLLIKEHRGVISSATEWSLVFALIRGAASHYVAGKPAFDLVSDLMLSMQSESPLRLDIIGGLIAILEEFAMVPSRILAVRGPRRQPSAHHSVSLQQGTMDRALQAINSLHSLKDTIPAWIAQSPASYEEAWRAGWTPLLAALGRQSSVLSPEIRAAALTNLQRILLSTHLVSDGRALDASHLFYNVIFPMVDDVLSPELDERRGRREMSETRLKASTLLCKSFLQFEIGPVVPSPAQLREIWLIILDFMDRLMQSGGEQDQLFEAIPESLKNLVLVMNASNVLLPPEASSQGGELTLLWTETRDRLEQFLPGFLSELIPTPPQNPEATKDTVASDTATGSPAHVVT